MITNSQIGDGVKIYHGAVVDGCNIGDNVTIWRFANLYGCNIAEDSTIGPWVEVQNEVSVGSNTTISSHTHVSTKTDVGDHCFIGHGVMFINNRNPPGDFEDWEPIRIGDNVVIGSNSSIMPVEIGEGATVGAGAVVTDDVPPGATVVGNPAEQIEPHGN